LGNTNLTKTGLNSGALEGYAIPVPLVESAVFNHAKKSGAKS